MKSFLTFASSLVPLLLVLLVLPWKIYCHPVYDAQGFYQDIDEAAAAPTRTKLGRTLTAPPSRRRNPEESGNFEGDIIISDGTEKNELEHGIMSSGLIGNHYRWPQNTIPYEISSEFSFTNRHKILVGMNDIEKHTCLRFRAKISSDKHFIKVVPGDGCSSFVGRQTKVGGQDVKLAQDGCMSHGIIMHELIHALGFWHEQSRTDRDEYVQILLENIKPDHAHNFEKYTSKDVNDYGLPYDYSSLMHYEPDAFILQSAQDLGKKTIIPNIRNAVIGQRSELSKYDVIKINRMYNCQAKASSSPGAQLRSNAVSSAPNVLTKDFGSFYVKVSIVKKAS